MAEKGKCKACYCCHHRRDCLRCINEISRSAHPLHHDHCARIAARGQHADEGIQHGSERDTCQKYPFRCETGPDAEQENGDEDGEGTDATEAQLGGHAGSGQKEKRSRDAKGSACRNAQNLRACHLVAAEPLQDGADDPKHRARSKGTSDAWKAIGQDFGPMEVGQERPCSIRCAPEEDRAGQEKDEHRN